MTIWPRLLLIALLCLVLVPLPAIADAHPGFHVNPHVPNIVLYCAIGFAALAWLTMVTYLLIARRRLQRARDRMIRARLNLIEAQEQLVYWRGVRDYWRARRSLAPTDIRAAVSLVRKLNRRDN